MAATVYVALCVRVFVPNNDNSWSMDRRLWLQTVYVALCVRVFVTNNDNSWSMDRRLWLQTVYAALCQCLCDYNNDNSWSMDRRLWLQTVYVALCVNVFVTIITIIDEVRAGASGCKQCMYVACSAAVRADKTSSLCAQTRLHSTQRGVA